MDKPDFQEVIEDLPVVTFATQLRRLDAGLSAAEAGHDAMVRVWVSDLKALLGFIKDRDDRICWFTTCKSCSQMWDANYAMHEALEALVDEQNGPPLLRDKEQWEAAMAKAYKVLGREANNGAT